MEKNRKKIKGFHLNYNKLLNKRSKYLNNLLQENINTKKVLTNEKEELLVDKLYNYGKFDRDYSIFAPPVQENSILRSKSKKHKLNIFPGLRAFIVSPEERKFPDKYKKQDYISDDFSNIYKNSSLGMYNKNAIPYSNRFKTKKMLNKMDNNISTPFLTNVGKNVVSVSLNQESIGSRRRHKIILPSIV